MLTRVSRQTACVRAAGSQLAGVARCVAHGGARFMGRRPSGEPPPEIAARFATMGAYMCLCPAEIAVVSSYSSGGPLRHLSLAPVACDLSPSAPPAMNSSGTVARSRRRGNTLAPNSPMRGSVFGPISFGPLADGRGVQHADGEEIVWLMVDVDGQHDELDDDRFVTRAPPVMPRVSDADRTSRARL